MADRVSVVDGPLVEGARTVEAAASRLKDKVVSGAEERLESTREYVSENPLKAILLALGVGALIGFLIGRRTA
jgi:ElaB/YqjD/DUF883 family membrane-anchored ribosome-binding protein